MSAGVAAVLLAAALFGTTGTAQALGPDTTTPLGVGAVRLLVGGLGLLALVPLRAAAGLWRTRAGLVAAGCTALYQVAFFAAVEQAGVAVGTLITIGSGPVFAGLLARVLLAEPVLPSWLVATGICVAGLGLLSGTAPTAEPVGIALALLAGLAYAGYTVLAKQLLDTGARPTVVLAAAFGLGGLLLVPVLVVVSPVWLLTPAGVALAAWLGVMTTTLAYVLFGRGLAVLPAGPVATLVLAEPLVATLLGTLLLGERLDLLGVLGAGLVLVGVATQVRAARRSLTPTASPPVLEPPR